MKKSKREYTVYVMTTLPKPHNTFIYLHVSQYYQEAGMLHIIENKQDHVHNMSHVKEIRIRDKI